MQKTHQTIIDTLFVLCLFCVFCSSAVGVVLIGVGVYKNTAADMQMNFSTRTALSYITEKSRQSDTENSVSLRQIENHETIVFNVSADGYDFETIIFFDDGYIKELSVLKDSEIPLFAAQPIVSVKGFEVTELEAGIFEVTVTDESGEQDRVVFSMASN